MNTTFRIGTDELTVSRDMILAAMNQYDQRHRVSDNDSGLRYALIYANKSYPPKHVLSLAINRPRSSFSGGEGKRSANRVFTQLGFDIVSIRKTTSTPELTAPIPEIDKLLSELFTQKWVNLHESEKKAYEGLNNVEYPGVYLIAYCDEDLTRQKVTADKVYYVGMSHAGLAKRLGQFIDGLEYGKYHSGADRFYKQHGNTPYSQLTDKKTFFVVSVAVPCVTSKRSRSPKDLRKMGEVSRLELYALARIRAETGSEPELNKK